MSSRLCVLRREPQLVQNLFLDKFNDNNERWFSREAVNQQSIIYHFYECVLEPISLVNILNVHKQSFKNYR